jgi:hypothetical protein
VYYHPQLITLVNENAGTYAYDFDATVFKRVYISFPFYEEENDIGEVVLLIRCPAFSCRQLIVSLNWFLKWS